MVVSAGTVLCQKVVDAGGNVSYREIPSSAAPGISNTVSAAIGVVGSALYAAGSTVSTPLALGAGVAAAPTLTELVLNTVANAASGNIVGAISNGFPALFGLATLATALFTPSPKGLSDDQIKTAVAALTHEQLIGLLDNAAGRLGGGIAGGDAGAGVASAAGASSAPVPTAASTVHTG